MFFISLILKVHKEPKTLTKNISEEVVNISSGTGLNVNCGLDHNFVPFLSGLKCEQYAFSYRQIDKDTNGTKMEKNVEFCCDFFSEEVQLFLTNLTCRSQGSESHYLLKEPKKQDCTFNAATA